MQIHDLVIPKTMSSHLLPPASLYSEAVADIVGALRQFRSCLFLASTANCATSAPFLDLLDHDHDRHIYPFHKLSLYRFHRCRFRHYLLNLTLGWVIWHFIVRSVLQGAQTFQQGAGILRGTSIEKSFLVLKRA